MQMQMQMQRMFMFSWKFADVELGVCRKELNSDIPPAHGYPQQVVIIMMLILVDLKILVSVNNYHCDDDPAKNNEADVDVGDVAAT